MKQLIVNFRDYFERSAVVLCAVVYLAASFSGFAQAAVAPANAPIPTTLTNQVLFNRPASAGGTMAQQYTFSDTVIRALNATPAGANVHISMFSIDIVVVIDAIERAKARGANIRFTIFDERANTDQVRRLAAILGTDVTKPSWLKICVGSCLSSNNSAGQDHYVQHAKAVAIDKIVAPNNTTQQYITFIGSANFSGGNAATSWNETRVWVNNATLYTATKDYVNLQRKDATLTADRPVAISGSDRVYYWPRQSEYDLALSALNDTSCAAPAGFGRNGKTVVRVAMYAWTLTRIEIAKRLVALHKAGCDVSVIYNNMPEHYTLEREVAKTLIEGGVVTYDGRVDSNGDGLKDMYNHYKMWLIDGRVSGAGRTYAWGGSANFTRNAMLRNTEITSRTSSATVTRQYLSQWELMRTYSRRETVVPITTPAASPGSETEDAEMGEALAD